MRRRKQRREREKKSWNKAVSAEREAKERLCGRVSYFASLAASAGGLCLCVDLRGCVRTRKRESI